MFDVIYLAAGVGQRTNLGYPKQLALLGGKPIMIHSLETFERISAVKQIIVVYIPNMKMVFETLLKTYGITKAILVEGGATRQISVYNGLQFVKTEKIMIHEAARPFITETFITNLIFSSDEAIIPIIDIPFTVVNVESFFGTYYKRENLRNIQLPQVYSTKLLNSAHNFVKSLNINNFTDDSSLVSFYLNSKKEFEDYGRINFVMGLEENIKITSPLDLRLAEVIYNECCNYNRS